MGRGGKGGGKSQENFMLKLYAYVKILCLFNHDIDLSTCNYAWTY